MKKQRCTILALLLCLLLTVSVFAAQTPVISATSVVGNAGETVTLSVNIRQNSGLAGWMLEISWNPSVLSLDSEITSGDAFSGGTLLPGKKEDGRQLIFWYDAQNRSMDGEMLSLRFKIADQAKSGNYAVGIQVLADNTVDENGTPVTVYASGGSVQVNGTAPDAATGEADDLIEAAPTLNTFADVSDTHWAKAYIEALAQRAIVSGSDGRFDPERRVTRAEFVKMLAGVLNVDVSAYQSSGFSDVPSESWASPYIAWAAENGFVTGIDETHFQPNANITREQIAVILYRCTRALSLEIPQSQTATSFSDTAQISGYAKEAVEQIARAGWIGGYPDGTFRPKGNTTRAEAAKLLAGILENAEG